jgi:hypothetical protein
MWLYVMEVAHLLSGLDIPTIIFPVLSYVDEDTLLELAYRKTTLAIRVQLRESNVSQV